MPHASDSRQPLVPHTALDADSVRNAYRRWASVYDLVFGGISGWGRRRAAFEVNRLPGTRVLEVVATDGLSNVEDLLELDAENTGFAAGRFDIAVGMFVASVVPNPRRLLAELRRVVRPGGHILFVNHFAAKDGPRWWVERAMAPASRALGWHPDFAIDALFAPADAASVQLTAVPPFGLFTLAKLHN